MNERDRLAAAIAEAMKASMSRPGFGYIDFSWRPGDDDAELLDEAADLAAHFPPGWTRLDEERLARALRRLDFSASGSSADMPEDFARAVAAAIAKAYREDDG